jgi:hypothetical protein
MTDRVSGPKGPMAPRLPVEEKLARQSPGQAPAKIADADPSGPGRDDD